MFVARFPFTAKFPQSISFSANDHFLGLRKENDHWLYVFHEDGRLGAVPANYVEELDLKSPGNVYEIIDSAVSALSDKDIYEKEIILNYLQDLKNWFSLGRPNASLPPLPFRKKKLQPSTRPGSRFNSLVKTENTDNEENKSTAKRLRGVSFLMVDRLRNSTLSSFDQCVSGFVKMLQVLSDADSQFTALCDELVSELLDSNPTVRRSVYVRTEDWKGLQGHIDHLERRAKDQQESGWPLVEDDFTVISDLDAFIELLCNADTDMVRTCLSDDRLPLALTYLYRSEKRVLVRRFYLLVIVATCHIQPAVWPVYLDSGLPMEIVREIRSSEVAYLDLILNLRVLTVLLTKSNNLPVDLQSELDQSFFSCVFTSVSRSLTAGVTLNGAESSLTGAMRKLEVSDIKSTQPKSHGDSISTPSILLLDTFFQFLCAANRHFCTSQSTPLTPIMITFLEDHVVTRDLIERLLYIFNRDVDPLNLNGVSFVRRLRGTLHEGFEISSQLHSGSLLYQNPENESDSGLFTRSHRLSSVHNDAGEYGAAIDVQVGNSDNAAGAEDGGTRLSASCKSSRQRTGLTDATLQLAPDTPRNAARKLLADIFSNRDTASLIYRNDANVVIDVIIRQICDLPANSPKLSEFLYCVDKVIRNTDCMSRSSGPYRLDDLVEALRGVEFSANVSSTPNSRDFTTSRSLRLTNDLLTLLSSMAS